MDSHDYAGLNGASGRAIFFRPERYNVEQLLPLRLQLELYREGEQIGCRLRDLSQGGVGLVVAAEVGLKIGDHIERLRLRVDTSVLYDGCAVVASSREEGNEVTLGLSVSDRPIDVEAVVAMRTVRAWDRDGAQPLDSRRRVWSVDGHREFRAELHDLKMYMDGARAHLDELDASLPWEVLHGPERTPAQVAVLELVDRDFRREFDRRVEHLFRLIRPLSRSESERLVPCSQHMVQHHFIQAPWLERALRKPLGYAGDYLVMDHMYRREFEGRTLFAKAMSWASINAPSPTAVRTRKELNKRCLHALFERHRDREEPVRVMLLASGPAQEVYELLQEREMVPRSVEIVLFDQDPGALSFAHARLRHMAERRFPEQVRIVFLHDTIRRLTRGEAMVAYVGRMNAIICSGLYDYLPDRVAVRLTASLFSLLAPGGFANIGNMDRGNPNRWVMEHLLDWWLIFRDQEEMLAFSRKAAPGARLEILTEETGINPFVVLHKE